jgi:hypothetical protein
MATRGAIGKQGQRRSCTPSGNVDVAARGGMEGGEGRGGGAWGWAGTVALGGGG